MVKVSSLFAVSALLKYCFCYNTLLIFQISSSSIFQFFQNSSSSIFLKIKKTLLFNHSKSVQPVYDTIQTVLITVHDQNLALVSSVLPPQGVPFGTEDSCWGHTGPKCPRAHGTNCTVLSIHPNVQ